MSEKRLADVEEGKKVVIKDIVCDGCMKKRLYELGLIPGQKIEVLQNGLFGGPIKIKVKDYCLALRRKEAKNIVIEENNG